MAKPEKGKNKHYQNARDEQAEIARQAEKKAAEADAKDKRRAKLWHAVYSVSKTFVMGFRNIFSRKIKKNEQQLSLGDSNSVVNKIDSGVNGGTKPNFKVEDKKGETWFAKKAVNCMGYYKIEGVLLTVDGYNVQKLVDPETAIEAYRGKMQGEGDVSFQKFQKNVVDEKELDLFKFSKHPEIASDDTYATVQGLGNQILREHITDWLLCNFDTKGENFVVTKSTEGYVLHGIDKEAAFNNLNDPLAAHMSTDYHPHKNNTLYNVVFNAYAEGKIDLDLDQMTDKVNAIVNMDDDTYMENFRNYLDYQREKHPDTYADTYMKILERKHNLGDEYNRFFGELVQKRLNNPDRASEREMLEERYKINIQNAAGEDQAKDKNNFHIFQPADKSPVAKYRNTLTKFRESAFALMQNPKSIRQGIGYLLEYQHLSNKFNKMILEGKTSDHDLRLAFNKKDVLAVRSKISKSNQLDQYVSQFKSISQYKDFNVDMKNSAGCLYVLSGITQTINKQNELNKTQELNQNKNLSNNMENADMTMSRLSPI